MNKVSMVLAGLLVTGCSASERLPVVDAEGALVGSYDPANDQAELAVDGDSVATSSGEEAAIEDGRVTLADGLLPGDVLDVRDASGRTIESLTVLEAGAADGLSEDEAASTFGHCIEYF